MKSYVLRDDTLGDKNLAYIFYHQNSGNWFVELADDADEWELPCILEHFARNGERTIGSYWAREFVRNRIIPPDRQNLGTILRDNRLREYDEFKLFLLSDGRCAQDDCYIIPIKYEELPKSIQKRQSRYIETADICSDEMLIVLKNGEVYSVDLNLKNGVQRSSQINRLLAYMDRIKGVTKDCGGCGITYDEDGFIHTENLISMGRKLPISANMLKNYATSELISTTEAMKMLGCTRQNLDDFVKRGKLNPAPVNATCRMYYRSDILNL